MMWKRILIVLAALAMLVALAGCFGGRQDTPGYVSTTPTVDPTAPTEEPTTAPIVQEPIYGTWTWVDLTSYRLVLNEDNSGVRGMPQSMITFEWASPGPGRLLIRTHTEWEDWDYTIVDGVLTITSRQADLTYSYIRA